MIRGIEMTEHKYANLLRYAANNADARFISKKFNETHGYDSKKTFCIETACINFGWGDWEIYAESKDEVSYDFVRVGAYLDKELMLKEIRGLSSYIPIKITKSPNGKVKVEALE